MRAELKMNLSILYRGPLASCNYGCGYCPFAKHAETPAERASDTVALTRFESWVDQRPAGDRVSVLFTPWGEALVRRRYRETLTRLSHLPQIEKVAAQTNLAYGLDWLAEVDRRTFALWVTYHPTETTRARFLSRCARLDALGIRYSVGVVGLREHLGEIEGLRRELPVGVYLWVNAFRRVPGGYSEDELARLEAVDPLFRLNVQPHPSLGKSCRGGAEVISVDGEGTMRRCHFIKIPIGNLYEPGWERALGERPCVNATCGCHIGYVHLDELDLRAVFGAGLLERIPAEPIWQRAHTA